MKRKRKNKNKNKNKRKKQKKTNQIKIDNSFSYRIYINSLLCAMYTLLAVVLFVENII